MPKNQNGADMSNGIAVVGSVVGLPLAKCARQPGSAGNEFVPPVDFVLEFSGDATDIAPSPDLVLQGTEPAGDTGPKGDFDQNTEKAFEEPDDPKILAIADDVIPVAPDSRNSGKPSSVVMEGKEGLQPQSSQSAFYEVASVPTEIDSSSTSDGMILDRMVVFPGDVEKVNKAVTAAAHGLSHVPARNAPEPEKSTLDAAHTFDAALFDQSAVKPPARAKQGLIPTILAGNAGDSAGNPVHKIVTNSVVAEPIPAKATQSQPGLLAQPADQDSVSKPPLSEPEAERTAVDVETVSGQLSVDDLDGIQMRSTQPQIVVGPKSPTFKISGNSGLLNLKTEFKAGFSGPSDPAVTVQLVTASKERQASDAALPVLTNPVQDKPVSADFPLEAKISVPGPDKTIQPEKEIVPELRGHDALQGGFARAHVSHHADAQLRAGLPVQNVVRQILDVVPSLADGGIEISLRPEELGRLRLSLTHVDGTAVLNLVADRPETLELVRRNITLLSDAFAAQGFAKLEVAIGGDRGPSARDNDQSAIHADQRIECESEAHDVSPREVVRSKPDSLDIRL